MSVENKIEEIEEGAPVTVISKDEQKARKLILKLGLKKIEMISRVTFKRKGNLIVAIENPEVYRTPAGSYVVFGEAKVEDLTQRIAEAQAAQAAAQAAAASASGEAPKDPASITADLQAASLEDKAPAAEEEEGDVDETGLDAGDIDIIMEQSDVSRAKAVKALRDNNGDMVNAIMSLTT